MSWKFVLNGNYGGYNNEIEVSAVAGKLGYEFFLFGDKVYFRDKVLLRIFETQITEKDLI